MAFSINHDNGRLIAGLDDGLLPVGDAEAALYALVEVLNKRPDSMRKELSIYRKNVPLMLEYVAGLILVNRQQHEMMEFHIGKPAGNKHKSWTKEDDAALIELVCDTNYTITQIAVALGRTPMSIQTRVSRLVGLRRLSQEIAGRFVGQIDGKTADAQLVGTLYKEEK